MNLPEDKETLPRVLGRAGYATGLIGKAHFQSLAPPSLESQPTAISISGAGSTGPGMGSTI